jgi:peptidyl-prolyl cis-trans isomerase SurA
MLKKTKSMLLSLPKKGIFFVGVCFMGGATFVQANEPVRLLDTVVARVNQELVLHSELEELCKQFELEGHTVDAAKKQELVRELVVNKIFLAEAVASGYKPPKEHIQRECEMTIASWIQRIGSESKLVAYFQQPLQRIKKDLKRSLRTKYATFAMHHKLTEQVTVTPAEVKAYFDALPSSQRTYYSSAFDVRQLVIYPKIADGRKEASKQKLLKLRKTILDGTATFHDLAKAHSDDPHSAARGGEIGWVPKGILTPSYEAAALGLQVGEISEPIVSEFGLHLIELIGRTKDRYNTRHILQALAPTQEEINAAETELHAIRAQIVAGTLSFETAVKQYSEDLQTRAEGGVIAACASGGDTLPSTLLPADTLDPTVYFAVEGLQEGETTVPQYMGKKGKWGWRLLYLKTKVEAHGMNLTQDYEKLYQQVLQAKKQEAIQKWIQQAQSTFVIQVAPEYSTEKLF